MGIYLFMLAGYQGVFSFFNKTISEDLITQLDKGDYTDAELVEIKIPYPMLYASNWASYQRYDGEVEMDGTHYNYVKRKFSNDTLYLLCIPNHQKTKLEAARLAYIQNTNDAVNPQDGKKSTPSAASQKAFSWEYHNLITEYCVQPPAMPLNKQYGSNLYALSTVFDAAPFQPPRHTPAVIV